MGAISDSIAAAMADLRDADGVAVVYRRGATELTLTAVKGRRTVLADAAGASLVVEAQVQDWLVAAADLVLGGVAVEPARGDQIVVPATGGSGTVYEVLPLSGETPWSEEDPAGSTLRVHTKRVGTESA